MPLSNLLAVVAIAVLFTMHTMAMLMLMRIKPDTVAAMASSRAMRRRTALGDHSDEE